MSRLRQGSVLCAVLRMIGVVNLGLGTVGLAGALVFSYFPNADWIGLLGGSLAYACGLAASTGTERAHLYAAVAMFIIHGLLIVSGGLLWMGRSGGYRIARVGGMLLILVFLAYHAAATVVAWQNVYDNGHASPVDTELLGSTTHGIVSIFRVTYQEILRAAGRLPEIAYALFLVTALSPRFLSRASQGSQLDQRLCQHNESARAARSAVASLFGNLNTWIGALGLVSTLAQLENNWLWITWTAAPVSTAFAIGHASLRLVTASLQIASGIALMRRSPYGLPLAMAYALAEVGLRFPYSLFDSLRIAPIRFAGEHAAGVVIYTVAYELLWFSFPIVLLLFLSARLIKVRPSRKTS